MLRTAKIDFIDFLQIEVAFLKTNYITSSNLPIPIDKQNMSEKKKFHSGRWLLNFYRHLLLIGFETRRESVIIIIYGIYTVITFFAWRPPLGHSLSCFQCSNPLLQTPFFLWMICSFQNSSQTVKDDKRNSCQYKLLLKPCEHLIQYVNVEVKFIQELSKTTRQFSVMTLRFQDLLFVFIFFLFFLLERVQKVVYHL